MRALADDTLVAYSVDSTEARELTGVWRGRLLKFAALCGVWAVPGLVAGVALGTLAESAAGLAPVSLPRALAWQLCAWIPWAGWTALISWLVRVLPMRRESWKPALLGYASVGVVVVGFQTLWIVLLDKAFYPVATPPFAEHARRALFSYADWLIVTYMAVVVAGIGYDFARRFREGQLAAERLRTEMVQAQLLALRSQLNPHFLFNALNSVISLMDRDVPAAQRMVARIGELLRLSLGADEAEVPLSRELSLVQQYLEIERIRFGGRLTFAIDVPPDLFEIRVPNLTLQPLVENAIVHGVGPRPGPGRVTLQAMRLGETLLLRVVDDGLGLEHANGRSGHGIGVGNTRARLAAIYGDAASLALKPSEWGGCVAEVRLPLNVPALV